MSECGARVGNDTDRGQLKYAEEGISQCHFFATNLMCRYILARDQTLTPMVTAIF